MRLDEKTGKRIITKQDVKKSVLKGGLAEFIFAAAAALLVCGLLFVISPLTAEMNEALEGVNPALKYQTLAVKVRYYPLILFCLALPLTAIGGAVYYFVKYFKLRTEGFTVEIDDVNYLDSKLVRSGRHSKRILVIHFFKYGKYVTGYNFSEYFADHKEEFYVVVSKGKEPRILEIYRRSKFEYVE